MLMLIMALTPTLCNFFELKINPLPSSGSFFYCSPAPCTIINAICTYVHLYFTYTYMQTLTLSCINAYL